MWGNKSPNTIFLIYLPHMRTWRQIKQTGRHHDHLFRNSNEFETWQFSLCALALSCVLVHLNFLQRHNKVLFKCLFLFHSLVRQTFSFHTVFPVQNLSHICQLWFWSSLRLDMEMSSNIKHSKWKFWKAAPTILSLIDPLIDFSTKDLISLLGKVCLFPEFFPVLKIHIIPHFALYANS